MKFEIASGEEAAHGSMANRDVPDVRVVVTVARSELRRLILERAEITRRIGTIKQTIVGLCKLFGADELTEDLGGLAKGQTGVRRPGITQACREVLMDAGGPLAARNVCEQIQQRNLLKLPYSKNLVSAVTTVLSRLEKYGEARTVPGDDGPRTWVWVSGVEDGSFHPVDSTADSQA